MPFESPDWEEADTWNTESVEADTSLADLLVPGLTILSHPDRDRIGERAALTRLASKRQTCLSRLEPTFLAQGLDEARPLGDRHLSRQPIHLAPGPEEGDLVLDAGATPTKVEVDGHAVTARYQISAREIERGVVLILGRRVTLLLHPMPPVLPEGDAPFHGLVGRSDAMARLRQALRQAAALDVPVLLCGETGTGKELAASAVHRASERHEQPFVAINMGAIPPTLAAAELFGASKGAFTGADRKHTGYFEEAHGGTLFLDEIGETPSEVQALLLRALESGEIQPVGGGARKKVDVRLITATDADLESAMADDRFRGPLYHRLSGYRVDLPALCERRQDLGELFVHFLRDELGDGDDLAGHGGRSWPLAKLTARLAHHTWPGNVRELRNVARRLAVAATSESDGGLLKLLDELLVSSARMRNGGDPPAATSDATSTSTAASSTASTDDTPSRRFRKRKSVSEDELLAALRDHGWRLKPTAESLKVSRTALYRMIEACGRIRKASEIERQEIEDTLARAGGDAEAAAADLEVSPHGLKLRMAELGLA